MKKQGTSTKRIGKNGRNCIGKIIAVDIEENNLVSVGEHISDVDLEARKKRPSHRLFMRRVGKNPATVRLRKHA
ncbi:MAG: hypothetical protein FIB07_00135 [Candidatus Methanoperedens sp.]|nr:hypothetical protein [Candidatus Methanoperedens sp.]